MYALMTDSPTKDLNVSARPITCQKEKGQLQVFPETPNLMHIFSFSSSAGDIFHFVLIIIRTSCIRLRRRGGWSTCLFSFPPLACSWFLVRLPWSTPFLLLTRENHSINKMVHFGTRDCGTANTAKARGKKISSENVFATRERRQQTHPSVYPCAVAQPSL